MRWLSMISIVLIFLRVLLALRIVVDSEFSRISNLRRLLLIFRMLTSILTTMRTTNVSIVLNVVEFLLIVVVWRMWRVFVVLDRRLFACQYVFDSCFEDFF
jgi:ABC-type sulfate transport system permease component